MQLPSKLIENAVNAFAILPGIGKRTALRLSLHVLSMPKEEVESFTDAIKRMRDEATFCEECHNISDGGLCSICASHRRNREVVCIVEGIRDVLAIENTQQYNGLYHVLGGVISPLEGKGPGDLNLESLVNRISKGEIKEVILALNPTIEGDTTGYYLSRQLKEMPVEISSIARGVSFGGELEYADELTLGRSITSRLPYKQG